MTDFQFNFIEGVWWIGLGLSIFPFRYSCSIVRKYRLPLCATLILFGISDFVEMATGAWWQPWWLLVWKTACIVLGIIFFIFIYKERNSR